MILAMIGSAYWWFKVQQSIGIIQAITKPWLFDYEIIWGSLRQVGPMGRLLAFKDYIVPLSFLLITMNPKRKWLYLFFALLALILTQSPRRGMLFFTFVWGIYIVIVSLAIQSKAGMKEKVKELLGFMRNISAPLLLLLLLYFAITQIWFGKSFSYGRHFYYMAETKIPHQLIDIYLYSCGQYSALEPHIERGNIVPYQHFLWVPRKIAHALSPSRFEEPLPMLDYEGVYIPFWWNVSSYIKFIYNDFGVVGVIIVPFILALLSSIFFIKATRKPNPVVLMFVTYLMLELSRTIIITGLIRYEGYWTTFILIVWGMLFKKYMKGDNPHENP